MKAADLMGSRTPDGAQYAVAFYIPSDPPFHSVDLAWMLLRFQDFHIRDCDYQRFSLISLSYVIQYRGTTGLLLFDKDLHGAYEKADNRAQQDPKKFRSARFGLPISTFPPDSDFPDIRQEKHMLKIILSAT